MPALQEATAELLEQTLCRSREGLRGKAAGVGPQDRALTARRTQTGYMLHVIFKMLQEMCNRNKPLVNKSMV